MKRPEIKVLHTCPLGTGGITGMVLNICEHTDRERINFDYLVYRSCHEYNEDRALSLGGKKYVADNSEAKGSFLKFWVKFRNVYGVLKDADDDIFHINASTPYDTLVGISARLAGIKRVIVHSHNANNSNKSKGWILINKFARLIMPLYTDAYLTCSTEAAEFMFPKRVYAAKRYTYIHNGIDVEKFRYDGKARNRVRSETGLDGAFVIGTVGRLSKQKNHSFLLDVFYELQRKEPDSRLLLIGVGELEQELKDKAGKLGISDKVIFYGAADNVNELLQAMDVFVMTSFHEGLPVVGIEAQTSGLPCVFSDAVTREADISGGSRFISLKEDGSLWADEIIDIYKSAGDRAAGAAAAREAGFDILSAARELEEVYYRVSGK